MLKNGVGRYNIFFFYFYTKLGQQPFDILGWGMDVRDFSFGINDFLKK